jgi:hypothetical protein
MEWTRDGITTAIQRHKAETGDLPTHNAWSKADRPSYAPTSATVARAFGTWTAGIEAAGLAPRKEWTRETVIAAIQRYCTETGSPPIMRDWQPIGPDYAPSANPVIRLFGSWNEAIQAAGLTPHGWLAPGTVFGRLTVINYAGAVSTQSRYRCKCRCGNETTVYRTSLLHGKTKSCGCLKQELTPRRRVGEVFGRLTVIAVLSHKNCLCRCECGSSHVAKICNLRSGSIRSCGCMSRERMIAPGATFGRLTVLHFAETINDQGHYACRCICGAETIVRTQSLRAGLTRSCGCLHKDTLRARRGTHYKKRTSNARS